MYLKLIRYTILTSTLLLLFTAINIKADETRTRIAHISANMLIWDVQVGTLKAAFATELGVQIDNVLIINMNGNYFLKAITVEDTSNNTQYAYYWDLDNISGELYSTNNPSLYQTCCCIWIRCNECDAPCTTCTASIHEDSICEDHTLGSSNPICTTKAKTDGTIGGFH